jgi:hypothetical protein
MAETLRCPDIYILGDRENYGISRLNNTEKSRRRSRTAAKGVEISRFQELAGNGRIEVIFQTRYPDQWQEYKNHMRRRGLNPNLPLTTEHERARSQELLEFLDTDEFNQATMDVGAEAHAVAMSNANVEKVDKKIQTRPVVPMPLRVFQELCTRIPYVHEWYFLGLTHPIGHPEWEGTFANDVPQLPEEELAISLRHNLANVADSEWFKLGKHLTADGVDADVANAMAGCRLVPDPNDQIDGQHVPGDYEYVPTLENIQEEQDYFQEEDPELLMEVEQPGEEDIVVERVFPNADLYPRYLPRMGQPSEEQPLEIQPGNSSEILPRPSCRSKRTQSQTRGEYSNHNLVQHNPGRKQSEDNGGRKITLSRRCQRSPILCDAPGREEATPGVSECFVRVDRSGRISVRSLR